MAIIVAALLALTIASVEVDAWVSGLKVAHASEISELQRRIAVKDLKIKGRDRELAVLKARDTVIVRAIAHDSAVYASTKASLDSVKAAIDVDAAAHAGLVPILEVHQLETKYEAKVASCEHLSGEKDTRIDGLLAQIDNQAKTRADLDTNRTDEVKILKDTVAILKPPWIKRALGWIDDHVITLAIGAAGGFIIAKR